VLSIAGAAPLQVSVKVVVALKALVLALPLVGSLSLHPPEAVQLVALLEYAMEAVFLRGSEPWRRPPSGEHAGSPDDGRSIIAQLKVGSFLGAN
jgi:hypothetical protein